MTKNLVICNCLSPAILKKISQRSPGYPVRSLKKTDRFLLREVGEKKRVFSSSKIVKFHDTFSDSSYEPSMVYIFIPSIFPAASRVKMKASLDSGVTKKVSLPI